MLPSLTYLYGKPNAQGDIRSSMNDFKVYERLPFSFSGEGEHLLIKVRKTGLNTLFVARQLANYFGVKDALVTYAGLKDRFAVTEQWFGIHMPGKKVDDLTQFSFDGIEILAHERHNKKLRIGALSGNNFEISLKNVTDIDEVSRRWYAVCEHGVPNYFGEQRFGIDGGNIEKAKEMFAGKKIKDKKKRGIYLSAARSLLFNHLISKKITQGSFEQIQKGDVLMLAGTQSVFHLDEIDDILSQRFLDKDVDITLPLWGRGRLMTTGEPASFEQELSAEFPEYCQGLEDFGLKQERRRIRLCLSEGEINVDRENNSVILRFTLPSGCFATTILRELLDYNDLTERSADSRG